MIDFYPPNETRIEMGIATETAQEYLRLADRVLERGRVNEALHYIDRAQETLLRDRSVEIERPGSVIGETMRYGHLGNVLAEKARLAQGK